jgi:hypothetical protein
MPLGQRGRRLRHAVSTSRDEAVDATGNCRCTAGASHKERRSVALDHGFGNRRLAKMGHALFEFGNKLLPIKATIAASDYHLRSEDHRDDTNGRSAIGTFCGRLTVFRSHRSHSKSCPRPARLVVAGDGE